MSIWNKKYIDMTLGDAMKVTGIITLVSIGFSGVVALVGYGIDNEWFKPKKKTELYTTVANDTEEDEG
jgi:hypothetical protein